MLPRLPVPVCLPCSSWSSAPSCAHVCRHDNSCRGLPGCRASKQMALSPAPWRVVPQRGALAAIDLAGHRASAGAHRLAWLQWPAPEADGWQCGADPSCGVFWQASTWEGFSLPDLPLPLEQEAFRRPPWWHSPGVSSSAMLPRCPHRMWGEGQPRMCAHPAPGPGPAPRAPGLLQGARLLSGWWSGSAELGVRLSSSLCVLLPHTGWESQLLETGFLGIFLCPWWTLSRLPRYTPMPWTVLWAFRWLIFRIMLGAVSRTLVGHTSGMMCPRHVWWLCWASCRPSGCPLPARPHAGHFLWEAARAWGLFSSWCRGSH